LKSDDNPTPDEQTLKQAVQLHSRRLAEAERCTGKSWRDTPIMPRR